MDTASGLVYDVPVSFPLLPPDRIRTFDTPLLEASLAELKPLIAGLHATITIDDTNERQSRPQQQTAGVFDPSADEDEGGKSEEEAQPDLDALLRYAKRQLVLVRSEVDRRSQLRRQDAAQSRVEALLRRVESGSRAWASRSDDGDGGRSSISSSGDDSSDSDLAERPRVELQKGGARSNDQPPDTPDWLKPGGEPADAGAPASPVSALLPARSIVSAPASQDSQKAAQASKGNQRRGRGKKGHGSGGSRRLKRGSGGDVSVDGGSGLLGGGVAVVGPGGSSGMDGGVDSGFGGGLVDPIIDTMERSVRKSRTQRSGKGSGRQGQAGAGGKPPPAHGRRSRGQRGAGGGTIRPSSSRTTGARSRTSSGSEGSGESEAAAAGSRRQSGAPQSRLGKLIRGKKKRRAGLDTTVVESGGAIRVRNWGDAASKRRKVRRAKEKEEAERRAKLERKPTRPSERERPWRAGVPAGKSHSGKAKVSKQLEQRHREDSASDTGSRPSSSSRLGSGASRTQPTVLPPGPSPGQPADVPRATSKMGGVQAGEEPNQPVVGAATPGRVQVGTSEEPTQPVVGSAVPGRVQVGPSDERQGKTSEEAQETQHGSARRDDALAPQNQAEHVGRAAGAGGLARLSCSSVIGGAATQANPDARLATISDASTSRSVIAAASGAVETPRQADGLPIAVTEPVSGILAPIGSSELDHEQSFPFEGKGSGPAPIEGQPTESKQANDGAAPSSVEKGFIAVSFDTSQQAQHDQRKSDEVVGQQVSTGDSAVGSSTSAASAEDKPKARHDNIGGPGPGTRTPEHAVQAPVAAGQICMDVSTPEGEVCSGDFTVDRAAASPKNGDVGLDLSPGQASEGDSQPVGYRSSPSRPASTDSQFRDPQSVVSEPASAADTELLGSRASQSTAGVASSDVRTASTPGAVLAESTPRLGSGPAAKVVVARGVPVLPQAADKQPITPGPGGEFTPRGGRASRGVAIAASMAPPEDRSDRVPTDNSYSQTESPSVSGSSSHVGSLVGMAPQSTGPAGSSAVEATTEDGTRSGVGRALALIDGPTTYVSPIGPQIPSYAEAYPEFSAIFTGCMEGLSAIGHAVRGGHSGRKRGQKVQAQRADAMTAATHFVSMLQVAIELEKKEGVSSNGRSLASLENRLTREAYTALIAPVQQLSDGSAGASASGIAAGSDTTDEDDADESPLSPVSDGSSRVAAWGDADDELKLVRPVAGASDQKRRSSALENGDVSLSAGIAALRRRAGRGLGLGGPTTETPQAPQAMLPVRSGSHSRSSKEIVRAQGDLRSANAKLRALFELASDPTIQPGESISGEAPGVSEALARHGAHNSLQEQHFSRTFRVIRNRNEVYSLVCNALATWRHPPTGSRAPGGGAAGGDLWPATYGGGLWREMHWGLGVTPAWHLLWSWGKPPVQRSKLVVWQRVNHFKHARELCRKDLLKKNLGRYQCLGGRMARAFTIMPPTFVLPKEYLAFAEAFGRETFGAMAGDSVAAYATTNQSTARTVAAAAAAALSAGRPGSRGGGAADSGGGRSRSGSGDSGGPNWWILKPVGMSRGRGIELVTSIEDVRYGQDCVLQRYIRNPCLLDGYKFDLRLYVLVTSFSPVEAFLYGKGFARLSSRQYSTDAAGASDKAIHLTNSSIQKHVQAGAASTVHSAGQEHAGGTKISLQYLWQRLAEEGKDVAAAWANIVDVVVKSLVCLDDVVPHQPNSFEVFGYDVLLDENLRAWLIEVNSSPSMGIDSQLDARTKLGLIRDTVALVDPLPFSHEALLEVTERRIQMHKEAARRPHQVTIGSGLGSGSGAPLKESDRRQLDTDLFRVLRGRRPRVYGEMPARMGAYERICPGSEPFRRVMRLKFSQFASGTRAGKERLDQMAGLLGRVGLDASNREPSSGAGK